MEMLSARATKQNFFESIGSIFSAFQCFFTCWLIFNSEWHILSCVKTWVQKSFPEYYNSSLLELIYSKCLMLSNLKFFSKCPRFCCLLQSGEHEGRKSVKLTRPTFLFLWNHIHIWLQVQRNEMSLLLTSVLQEKILAVCQIHPGTFPDQVIFLLSNV